MSTKLSQINIYYMVSKANVTQPDNVFRVRSISPDVDFELKLYVYLYHQ